MIHLQEEVVGHPNRVDYILIDIKAWHTKKVTEEGGTYVRTVGKTKSGQIF